MDPKQPTVKVESYNKKTKKYEEESLKQEEQEGRTNQSQLMATNEDNDFKKTTSSSIEGTKSTSETPLL